MANPRSNTLGKGFWDGGEHGHSTNGESGGMRSGFPGVRRPRMTGIKTDLEKPAIDRPSVRHLEADDQKKSGGK